MRRVLALSFALAVILGLISFGFAWERGQRVRRANRELLTAMKADTFPRYAGIQGGRTTYVFDLLRRGASPTLRTDYGKTVLMHAASRGDLDAVKFCLRAGAGVDARDDEGSSPISYGCGSASPDVIKVLLAAGAGVNSRDKYGGTPLYYASHAGDARMVETLLAAGAAVNAQNRDGQTPLMAAADGYEPTAQSVLVAKILRDHGARDDLKDRYGLTALAHAKRRGHKLMVSYLAGR